MKRVRVLSLVMMVTLLLLGQGTVQAVTLRLTGWPYQVDTVNENLKVFKQQTGIEAVFVPFPSDQYRDRLVASFVAGTDFDVVYVRDNFLAEWAAAGWIIPIDRFPGVEQYVADLPEAAIQQMSYKGRLYGLPYYQGVRVFAYNADHLKRAGISAPPATWEELIAQARRLKEKGVVNKPIILQMKKGQYITQTLEDLTFSRGGRWFDPDNNPVFQQPNSALREAIEWIRQGLSDGLIDEASLNSDDHDVVRALSAGTHTYTIVADYDVKTMNDPASSREAGRIKVALIPGGRGVRSGATSYIRLYAITAASRHKEEAWKLVQFLGGKDVNGEYYVAKKWAIKFGLGFAYNSLYDDPEIKKAFGNWIDLNVWREQAKYAVPRPYRFTPWFAEWETIAWDEFQKAIVGATPLAASLDRLAKEWTKLKSEYE